MRCRKVRSLLSTYSRDELVGRQQAEVREHLAACADCRKEAATIASLRQAARELPRLSVSDDFTTKLLNKVAQERFAETRTRAYMPKRPPIVSWRVVVPALAMSALVLVVAVGLFLPGADNPGMLAGTQLGDDAYRTVQPQDNPNLNTPLQRNWSVNNVLARLDRVSQVSSRLSPGGFTQAQFATSAQRPSIGTRLPVPYVTYYYKVQPVIRVYENTGAVRAEEGKKVY